MRSPKALWIAGLLVLVVISLWKALNVYTEWLWISQVGYASVFVTIYKARLVLLLVVGAVLFFWLWGNCRIARRSTSEDITFIGKRLLPPAERAAIEQHIDKAIIIVTLLVAVVGAILASHRALPLLQFMNSTSFTGDDGTVLTDPIFGREIAFYVFRLPFYRDLFGWAFQFFVVTTLIVAALHYLNGGIQIQSQFQRVKPGVKVHLSVLLAMLAVLKAIGYQLDKFDLLYSPAGQVFGASYTDVNARLPALNLLILISLFAA
ncbi:MAG: UPF0182 family protein, partial [Armatimonadota bacterium]